MPRIAIHLDCPIHASARVRSIASMFDLRLAARASAHFAVEVPDVSEPWTIGLIVGPSGSGKTTIARRAFGEKLYAAMPWKRNRAVIDGFGDISTGTITRMLTAVGFSTPPAWLKPYQILSNGERFRCDLARALLCGSELVVFDEFTSLVDRTVARISSAAVARMIRGSGECDGLTACRADGVRSETTKSDGRSRPVRTPSPRYSVTPAQFFPRFVAVTCHYDVLHWLCPDWVIDMADQTLARRSLRRPQIPLCIARCDRARWQTFSRHHYLSGQIHRSAQCFLGTIDGRAATFVATLPFPHPVRPGWREHRTVCLPDFQGIGIGTAMSEFVASLYRATGKPYFSTTSHPAMIQHRSHSPYWRITRKPGRVHAGGATSSAPYMKRSASTNRVTAGFEYVGPGRMEEAQLLGLACARQSQES